MKICKKEERVSTNDNCFENIYLNVKNTHLELNINKIQQKTFYFYSFSLLTVLAFEIIYLCYKIKLKQITAQRGSIWLYGQNYFVTIILIFEFERRQFDWTNKIMNQHLNDFDNSLHLALVARSNLIGWNHPNEQLSQDISQINRIRENTNSFYMTLPNEPPRPGNNLYSCIQSQPSEESVIKEVPYLGTEVQNKLIKQVNSKQYFRMMKRRIKKGMQKILRGDSSELSIKKKKYLHQSRHNHAVTRLRGKDGKFLATRPPQQRFREKKKRGRKPKNAKLIQNSESSPKNNESMKTQLTPIKLNL